MNNQERQRRASYQPGAQPQVSIHRPVQLHAKMEHWIANGAQLGWLIDPEEKTVHVYRPNDSPEVLHHPTSVQGSGVVAGFELAIERVWE